MSDSLVLTNAKKARAEASIQVDDHGNALGTADNPLIVASATAEESPMLRVRGSSVTVAYDADTDARPTVNGRTDLDASNSIPEMSEIVRLGNSWSMAIPTASAFNHVAAWPTSRAELVLFNGEPFGGKSYVIESAWCMSLAIFTGNASAQVALVGQLVSDNGGTAVTDNANVLITPRSGRPNYGGRARKALANTAYGVASKWETIGTSAGPSPVAPIGFGVYADLNGGWIVPPGGLLLLNVVAGTTSTAGGIIGVTWHEAQLPVV